MQLAPRAPLANAVLAHLPLALPLEVDSRGVYHHMHWLVPSKHLDSHLKVLRMLGERGVVRGFAPNPAHSEHGVHKAVGLSIGKAKHPPDRETHLDSLIAEGALQSSATRRLRLTVEPQLRLKVKG